MGIRRRFGPLSWGGLWVWHESSVLSLVSVLLDGVLVDGLHPLEYALLAQLPGRLLPAHVHIAGHVEAFPAAAPPHSDEQEAIQAWVDTALDSVVPQGIVQY